MFVIAPRLRLAVCWFMCAASVPGGWACVFTLPRVTRDPPVWPRRFCTLQSGEMWRLCLSSWGGELRERCRGRARDNGARRLTGRAVRADEVPADDAAHHAGY